MIPPDSAARARPARMTSSHTSADAPPATARTSARGLAGLRRRGVCLRAHRPRVPRRSATEPRRAHLVGHARKGRIRALGSLPPPGPIVDSPPESVPLVELAEALMLPAESPEPDSSSPIAQAASATRNATDRSHERRGVIAATVARSVGARRGAARSFARASAPEVRTPSAPGGAGPCERERAVSSTYASAPWQRLNFCPEPHGHGSLRPIFGHSRT